MPEKLTADEVRFLLECKRPAPPTREDWDLGIPDWTWFAEEDDKDDNPAALPAVVLEALDDGNCYGGDYVGYASEKAAREALTRALVKLGSTSPRRRLAASA